MRWFGGSLVVGLANLILQGLEGKVPVVFSGMLANELYVVSIFMQFLGLHWFVVRKPIKSRWPWVALALIIAAYTIMFLGHIPYSGNVMNIPFVAICGASAWMLLQYGADRAGVRGQGHVARARHACAHRRRGIRNSSSRYIRRLRHSRRRAGEARNRGS
jgi:hypothetical protein